MIIYLAIIGGIIALAIGTYFGLNTTTRKVRRTVYIKLFDEDDHVLAVKKCVARKCEGDCLLSFQCGTQLESVRLSWDKWMEIKGKIKHLK